MIRRDDGGGEITFNTTYAQLNLKDTIETGDWVEVSYSGAGAPYTASTVNDYTRHVNAAEPQSVSAEGVITSLTPDTMQILDTNGICREFDLSESEFEMADGLYEGKYVISGVTGVVRGTLSYDYKVTFKEENKNESRSVSETGDGVEDADGSSQMSAEFVYQNGSYQLRSVNPGNIWYKQLQ